jgi:hypothetical protein
MEFKTGDIVETVSDERSWVAGALATVTSDCFDGDDTVDVEWHRTHPDGSRVLSRRGDPFNQSNGGYYLKRFRLYYRKICMEPRKYLKKLTL